MQQVLKPELKFFYSLPENIASPEKTFIFKTGKITA
jgi:hypothetical protein